MRAGIRTELVRINQRLFKLDAAQGPKFADMNPVRFVREQLRFCPDDWQAAVLSSQSKRILLNCCRQSGKSTITAALALHQAVYVRQSLILLVSPSLRQSSELFRKVQNFLALLTMRPALVEDNRLSLKLSNGSRIVSLPSSESTVRGFSGASLIVEDEASRVTDDLYFALRPMLAVSNGRHILMSTPWGRRGHFFEAWETGGPDWERVQITAPECPRISADFLAEECRSMPDLWYRSEYLCEFTEVAGQMFRESDLFSAISADVMPLRLGGTA